MAMKHVLDASMEVTQCELALRTAKQRGGKKEQRQATVNLRRAERRLAKQKKIANFPSL